jgi:hypothetical protein
MIGMDEMDEMDEELGGLPPSTEGDTSDDTTGGLSVYSDPGVQKAMTKFDELAKQQQARYDAQAKAIAKKRYGPSFSERMFQLSAALATPTAQRGIGGILANVTPVLQAQMQAKREGELSRREALEKLDANRLAQEMGLAKQGLSTSLALANLAKKGTGSQVTYATDRGGFVPKPGVGGAPPMPDMDDYGNYVITNPRQLVYLPANTPIVLPGGDPTKPKYTRAGTTR